MMKNRVLRFFVLLWVFAGLFFPKVGLTQDSDNGIVVDKIIAKVDNYIVLKSELELGYLDMITRGQNVDANSKCRVLQSLVFNKLLLAKSEIDSINVMDYEVERSLDSKLRYFVSQIGSEEKLEDYYGKSIEEFKEELRKQEKEQLLMQKMSEKITDDITITPGEVRKFFARIPTDSLPFFSKEVVIGQIVAYPQAGEAAKKQAKDLLLSLKNRIQNGENFNDLARQYSQEPIASKSGGELGFFRRGELDPKYEEAALSLKPGELSDPVESQFGFHLIQMIERRGNEFNSRHILIIPKPSQADIQKTINKLDSIRNLILKDSISFEKAARDFSEDKITNVNGGFFQDNSGSNQLSVEQLDPNTFFTIDSMKVGTISPPIIYTDDQGKQGVRLIFYKEAIKPHQANLDQDWSKILNAALNEKKQNALNDWFNKSIYEVFIQIDDEYKNCNILN